MDDKGQRARTQVTPYRDSCIAGRLRVLWRKMAARGAERIGSSGWGRRDAVDLVASGLCKDIYIVPNSSSSISLRTPLSNTAARVTRPPSRAEIYINEQHHGARSAARGRRRSNDASRRGMLVFERKYDCIVVALARPDAFPHLRLFPLAGAEDCCEFALALAAKAFFSTGSIKRWPFSRVRKRPPATPEHRPLRARMGYVSLALLRRGYVAFDSGEHVK